MVPDDSSDKAVVRIQMVIDGSIPRIRGIYDVYTAFFIPQIYIPHVFPEKKERANAL